MEIDKMNKRTQNKKDSINRSKSSKSSSGGSFPTVGLLVCLAVTAIFAAVLNYFWPTPWNVRSIEMWLKLIVIAAVYGVPNFGMLAGTGEALNDRGSTVLTAGFVLPFIMLLVLVIGLAGGMQIFHADEYANIISVEQIESAGMILSEDDTDSIALMDTASARQLGDREIGSIQNFSAFNVSDDYIQLNVRGDAIKIAPLEYAGFFKWMKNKDTGVTGFVVVSPTTMTADYIELSEGMQYVPSACFSKNLSRHLHKQFPSLIFNNTHFEIDEDGRPYYISSVYTKTIGIFSGDIVTGAIVTDPVNGESTYYDLADVPQWVDNVVSGDVICNLYNLAFKNKNGFWNGTVIGANAGCMQVTTVNYDDESGTDFGYIAQEGDIYIYTGVTSMAADSSNLGFIMANERTGECRYFPVAGANEQSAINAAEGEVQQYAYSASFPTLINIDGELTYLGVLKDKAGLVKMYYTVNVKDYGKVVVSPSREECIAKYIDKMGLNPPQEVVDNLTGDVEDPNAPAGDAENSSEKETEPEEPAEEVTFVIAAMQYADIEGNTWVYLGTEDGIVYRALFADNEQLLFAKKGDTVKGQSRGGKLTVEKIKSKKQ